MMPCGACYEALNGLMKVCGRPERHGGVHAPRPLPAEAGHPYRLLFDHEIESLDASGLERLLRDIGEEA
jgi:hypothetical protein